MSAQEHVDLDALATISAEDLLAAILGMPQIAPPSHEPPEGVTPLVSPSAYGEAVRGVPPTAYADDWEWMRAGNEVEAVPAAPATPAGPTVAAAPAAAAAAPKRRRLDDTDARVQRRRESIRESQRRIRGRHQESFKLYSAFFEWAGEKYPNILTEFSQLRKETI